LPSSQILSFSGIEDIEMWTRKIERMTMVHQVDDSIKLLAVTRNLHNLAQDWFDLKENSIAKSSDTFKEAILGRLIKYVHIINCKKYSQYLSFSLNVKKLNRLSEC